MLSSVLEKMFFKYHHKKHIRKFICITVWKVYGKETYEVTLNVWNRKKY